MSGDVSRLEDSLATLKEALEGYNKALTPVEDLLESTQKALASREPTGINVEKGKDQLKTVEEHVIFAHSARARR